VCGVVAAALCCAGARGQTCNVEDNAVLEFRQPSFPSLEDTIDAFKITPSQIVQGGKVVLVEAGEIGTSAQMWTRNQSRLADGFKADFEFSMDGTGRGVAFVAQSFSIDSIAGATGDALGYTDSVLNFLGVSILTCEGQDDNGNCDGLDNEVVIFTRGSNGVAQERARSTLSTPINNGDTFSATMLYLADLNEVQFRIDNTQVVAATGIDLLELFDNDRFGFLGVSTSVTGAQITADVAVESISLELQPSDTVLVSSKVETIFGRQVVLSVSSRDSCQVVIDSEPELADNVEAELRFAGSVDGVFEPPAQEQLGRDFLQPTAIVFNNATKRVDIVFDMPNSIEGVWDFSVSVNDVVPDLIPCEACVVTISPDVEDGIPIFGLALLIVLIILIILGLIYAVIRLRRYRRKLAENQADILAGKEKHHLDMLERDVQFNMNPLMGSLDEMRARLAQNEAELERLRAGRGERYDDEHTIGKLHEQNAALRDEMNKLKREAQQNDALNTTFRKPVGPAPTSKRKEYQPSRPY